MSSIRCRGGGELRHQLCEEPCPREEAAEEAPSIPHSSLEDMRHQRDLVQVGGISLPWVRSAIIAPPPTRYRDKHEQLVVTLRLKHIM